MKDFARHLFCSPRNDLFRHFIPPQDRTLSNKIKQLGGQNS